jgi:uncharacterized protein (TIGR02453 family)
VAPARTASATDRPPGEGRSFKGWRPEVVEFFDGLEMDNTKSYWTAHKEFYVTDVLGPMEALLAEMAPQFGEGRVFRPYRDTRFSPDKSPYKTNIAAHNDAGYISLSSDALGVGSGLWMPAPAQLTRYRAAVADEKRGAELARILSGLRRKRIQVSAHETLKSAPRGYPNDHPRIELLRFKGLTAWKEWPVGAWLGTAASKRRIIEVLRASAPLRKWLDSNVGTADGP